MSLGSSPLLPRHQDAVEGPSLGDTRLLGLEEGVVYQRVLRLADALQPSSSFRDISARAPFVDLGSSRSQPHAAWLEDTVGYPPRHRRLRVRFQSIVADLSDIPSMVDLVLVRRTWNLADSRHSFHACIFENVDLVHLDPLTYSGRGTQNPIEAVWGFAELRPLNAEGFDS